jgi:SAM-dependent methyltransferase
MGAGEMSLSKWFRRRRSKFLERRSTRLGAKYRRPTGPALTTPVPPEDLIFLVAGHRDRSAFDADRRTAVPNVLLPRLAECGLDTSRLSSVLEFGCGCGRLLAGWEHVRPKDADLSAVDVNERLIAFVRENMPFVEATTTSFNPPLPFGEGQFDLVYNVSVFTHLPLWSAMMWAGEMCRVVKPGGYLVTTYHGDHYRDIVAQLSGAAVKELAATGFAGYSHPGEKDMPPGSNSYTAFQTTAFTKSLFKGFELIRNYTSRRDGYQPYSGHQDMAVFRRTSA